MAECFRADLHIHTALSPCAEREMTPLNIVRYARLCGLDILAITDHNTMGNAGSVVEAAAGRGPVVFPGIEVQTREEVHVLGIFPDLSSGASFCGEILSSLPRDGGDFGEQILLDSRDRELGREERALVFSSPLSLSRAVEGIRECGGLAIASHVDRRAHGLIGQLGFVPPEPVFDALEVSGGFLVGGGTAADILPEERDCTLICSSDAHRLREMGLTFTGFEMRAPTLEEMRLALGGRDERCAEPRFCDCG